MTHREVIVISDTEEDDTESDSSMETSSEPDDPEKQELKQQGMSCAICSFVSEMRRRWFPSLKKIVFLSSK